MFAWIVDHANVLAFVFVAALLGFAAAGWMTRRPRYWAATGAALGLLIFLWLLTRFVVSDQQQILLNLDAMRQGAIGRKADLILPHLAKDFRHGPIKRDELAKRINASVQSHKVNDIHLWDPKVTINGDVAEVLFNFRADAEVGGPYVITIKAMFIREDAQWKLRDFEVFKIGTTERQYIPGID